MSLRIIVVDKQQCFLFFFVLKQFRRSSNEKRKPQKNRGRPKDEPSKSRFPNEMIASFEIFAYSDGWPFAKGNYQWRMLSLVSFGQLFVVSITLDLDDCDDDND